MAHKIRREIVSLTKQFDAAERAGNEERMAQVAFRQMALEDQLAELEDAA